MERYYFDHNATTPVSPEVMEAFAGALAEVYGNASSVHRIGQAARQKLEEARAQVAALLNCERKEIVFVSGGTEADNLAVLGVVRHNRQARRHVITTAIEHPAVLGACAQLEQEGTAEVTRVQPDAGGVVDPDEIRRALRPDTVLISVMHTNNELGTVQPLEAIAAIAREAGVLLHSDGVQAAGKVPVDVKALGVDLYSITGHKIYAPKGVGALYVRSGVSLAPILHGGHHERDRRPGTENVPGAVALGRAAAWATEHVAAESARLSVLRDRLERGILDRVPGVRVNGDGAPRTANTCNLRFDGVDGEAMVIALDLKGFAVSAGSACSSGATEPSHVLIGIGLTPQEARSSLRFSLGRANTAAQVDALVEAIVAAAAHLRRLSPAYSHA